jgi:hypothetical protein
MNAGPDFGLENILAYEGKMKLFALLSATQTGERVDFKDPKRRLFGYFMWDTNDGKFLTHTTPRGVAQEGIAPADVARADYLDINIGIPVFSPKAVEIFRGSMADEMTFHPCVVECEGQDFPFFFGRINKRVALVDKARSTFRSLTDGEHVLSGAVFRSTFDEDFLIARDVEFPEQMAVTSAFRDLSLQHQLAIDFLDLPQ